MEATAIKKEILDRYDVFEPVKKAADLKGTIGGVEYRVKIQKGEAVKVMANRKAVWTPDDGDLMGFIHNLVYPDNGRKKTADAPEAPKKAKVVVDDRWIAHLEEVANETANLKDGDEIKFRVARSHGKPVCAHIDLYRDGTKVGTAGVHYRVGFATRGINDRWKSRVVEAAKEIYRKIGNSTLHTRGDAKVAVEEGQIVSAEGPVSDVLALLKTLG